MSIFSKILGRKKKNEEKPKGLTISISNEPKIGYTIGTSTGGDHNDYYVYSWYIKKTGEVFYVGKGRGDRYKKYHERAYEAERIREQYDTDVHFVGTGLTEYEALELETKEMTRILNTTNDRLTNRITPLLAKRGNGYEPSPTTPKLEFEKAPVLYATEIDEHYFGARHRAFDAVNDEHLQAVVFIMTNMRSEIDVIYGGNYHKYKEETEELLKVNGTRILKTQYAKTATAWIYIGDDDLHNYHLFQEKAKERLGKEMSVLHMIDVRNYLSEKYGKVELPVKVSLDINPVHNRVPLSQIKNINDWEKGFDEGYPLWGQGEEQRKSGNIEEAIKLYDEARYNGYEAPALYRSYAMAYRKLKDYHNEIATIDEAIERFGLEDRNTTIMQLVERRKKVLTLLEK